MIRIPLSISPSYVNWSWWQAIRELFQNGMDAHDRGQKLSYTYNENSQQLVIRNEGARLSRETLVLGATSKRNDAAQRGEFGEGYKLACSALCGLGAKIGIYNGGEYWVPEISHSETFGVDTLHFSICEVQNNYSLTFVITGVPKEEWESARAKLLFLHRPYPSSLTCREGTLIIDTSLAGNLYVKGIFVTNLPDKYSFGYDLSNVKLDRDRQSPDTRVLRTAIASTIRRLVESGQLQPSQVLDVLEIGGGETLAFESDYGTISDFHRKLSEAFDVKYGDSAIPVASLEEATRARDFTLNGVIVNAPLLRILRRVKSTLDRILASKALLVTKIWSATELSEEERVNLRWAITLSSKVEPLDLDKITIVDLAGDKLWGKFESAGNNVFIAKRILVDRVALMATLIHELCHRYGPDGHQSHRDAVEDRFAKLITLLSQNS